MTPFWYDMSQLWVGTFFYGIYLVLFCICIYILWNRRNRAGNTVLLVTAISLFVLCTAQSIINLVLGAADIDNINIPYDHLVLANTLIYVTNNVIADALVIYRCYSIWNRNKYVVILPIILLIVTSVYAWDIRLPLSPFFALSLATNVLVTSLSAGRIWWISRRSRAYLNTEVRKRYITSISVLVESGMIYPLSVLAYLILGAIPDASIVQEPLFQMIAQIVGIVPTLIIVRVALGLSIQDGDATASAEEAKLSGSRNRPSKPMHQVVGHDSSSYMLYNHKGLPSIPYDGSQAV
ncbi:hypothetical protein B0H10DRAFT_1378588 [Mycena sp. CBHHK59/15]|nr:hypothetical protein B0H10DRAFT_1378588 [Mycena sp. CBHHK59/15]